MLYCLRAGFGGVWGDFWKIECLLCCSNLIFKDRGLKNKYIVDGNPLITFLKKKFDEDGPRPDLGLGLGEFGGNSGKLNVFHAAKILFLQIEG